MAVALRICQASRALRITAIVSCTSRRTRTASARIAAAPSPACRALSMALLESGGNVPVGNGATWPYTRQPRQAEQTTPRRDSVGWAPSVPAHHDAAVVQPQQAAVA